MHGAESVAIETHEESDLVILTRGDLRLVFRRGEDRWEHAIEARQGEGWLPLLGSVPGTPAEELPLSPVFQDLRTETVAGNSLEVQLFGQSRKTIYSAAVRFDADSGTIEFDVAVRVPRGERANLFSSYESDGAFRAGATEEYQVDCGTARLELGGMRLPDDSTAGSGAVVALSTPVPRARFTIGCRESVADGTSRSAVTFRWQYWMRRYS